MPGRILLASSESVLPVQVAPAAQNTGPSFPASAYSLNRAQLRPTSYRNLRCASKGRVVPRGERLNTLRCLNASAEQASPATPRDGPCHTPPQSPFSIASKTPSAPSSTYSFFHWTTVTAKGAN